MTRRLLNKTGERERRPVRAVARLPREGVAGHFDRGERRQCSTGRRVAARIVQQAPRWGLLACAIVSEVTASLSLKAALDDPAFYILVAAGFAASFVFLTAVLRRGMALAAVYGIWAASGVWLTAVLSTMIYGEPLTRTMAAGLVLIVGGVLLVERGSHAARSTNPADAGGAA